MSSTRGRQWLRSTLAAFGVVIGVVGQLAAQAASITGTVSDQSNGQPLAGARVQASGTNYVGITTQQGTYTIRNVAPGSYTLRIVMLGYGSQQKSVTVAAGQASTVDWTLSAVPFTLEEIVTTATGEQLKRELGNSVATVEAAQLVSQAQTPDLTAILNGRIAGVTAIANDGVVGSGSRIRIRGISSASLSNDPLLYVDGIRVSERGQPLSVANGGNSPSFFNDINPEEIESIEVVKGPSAATLYGTQAANGVIRITTKRGKAGPPKWTLYTEHGLVQDKNKYLPIFFSEGTNGDQCLPYQQSANLCQIRALHSINLMTDPTYSPLKDAYRSQWGAQVNGGTETARYFVAGEFEDQNGTFKMPNSEIDFLHQLRGDVPIPKQQLDPSHLRKISLRTNLSAALSSKADVSLSSGYISNDNQIPQVGDNLEGAIGAATYGTADPAAPSPYGFARPAYGFANTSYRKSNHFINSGNVNFRPLSWLSTRGTVGLDYIGFEDLGLERNGEACPFCGNPQGDRTINRFQSYKYSVDVGGTATFKLSSKIGSKTSIGAQYNRDNLTASRNFGQNLPPGAETFTGAANKTSTEATVRVVTLGSYVEQQLSWNDRLFVTGAVRVDQNSAFGQDSRSATYPKVAASWVALENREKGLLNSLRLRASFGASGQQPKALDAVLYYTGNTNAIFGGNAPGVSLGAIDPTTGVFNTGLGNNLLRPERSKEIEAGFDVGILSNRIQIEATVYRKNTTDALVQRLLPGSAGGVNARTDNVGNVRNEGIEISINTRIIDRPNIQWDVQGEFAGNRNRLIELGEGVPPITGFGYQQVPGFPLYGIWWPKTTSFADANGDGLISPNEVTVTDEAVFNGGTIPTRTASINTSLALFKTRLRIGGQFEYKGGFYSHNVNGLFQCAFVGNCQGLNDPSSSLQDQANAVSGAFGDWAQDASFVRLRELNVSYTVPNGLRKAIGAQNATVTLTGRNLIHHMFHFTGWDSEINTAGGLNGDGPNYNFVQPGQLRYFTLRVNLQY